MKARLRKKAKEKDGKEAFLQENIEIFSELVKEVRKTTRAAGVHLMAVGSEWIVPKTISKSRAK